MPGPRLPKTIMPLLHYLAREAAGAAARAAGAAAAADEAAAPDEAPDAPPVRPVGMEPAPLDIAADDCACLSETPPWPRGAAGYAGPLAFEFCLPITFRGK